MTSVLVFVVGAVLLVYSAERMIDNLIGVARGLGVSLFLIAIVFTGIEFDDVALGVALNLEDLDGVALGTVIGATFSIIGVALALAAIVAPTRIHIPRDYIAIFAFAPIVMVGIALMGQLGSGVGAVLLSLFVAFVVYIAAREFSSEKAVFRDVEMHEKHPTELGTRGHNPDNQNAKAYATRVTTGGSGELFAGGAEPHPVENGPSADLGIIPIWTRIGFTLLAVIGLIVGSATMTFGTEGILDTYGLEGTVFGATIATAVLTIEDIFLTVAPARRGAPEIAVGNVIGSAVFSLTGKLGIILLAGGLVIGPHVLSWHLPALLVAVGLTAYFLSTGGLKRWHGYVLLSFYAIYWIVSLFVVGHPPVDDL